MNDSELILFLIEGNQEKTEDVSECFYYPESRKIIGLKFFILC
jgi:hypothetical protein